MTATHYINRSDIQDGLLNIDPDVLEYIRQCEAQIDKLSDIGYQLSKEHDLAKLLTRILDEAMEITYADGGTLYLLEDNQYLNFEIMKTQSLNVNWGGSSETQVPERIGPIPLYDEQGQENVHNVSAYVGLTGQTLNIPNAYACTDYDFSGAKAFDERFGYHSQSLLTMAMQNHEGNIIGVLQLLNATDPHTGQIIAFSQDQQKLIEALTAQAAVAITKVKLIEDLENLLESFVQLIADAIDKKSPYTGAHCSRVPVLAMMLAEKVHQATEGPFAEIFFTEEDMNALRIAAWLHDIGKITTPEYIVDKARKLETIYDRIHEVDIRFEVLRRDIEIQYLHRSVNVSNPKEKDILVAEKETLLTQLDEDQEFLKTCNTGSETMSASQKERVHQIAQYKIVIQGEEQNLLCEDWIKNLTISRGTLNETEREKIREHITVTIDMLEKLPFPKHLERVPEYAGGHHETMNGTGYPKGLYKDQMSIQARILGIADIFEALTATDRPYKTGKCLQETLDIMDQFNANQHIDPDLFDLFINERIYQDYAEQFLT